MREQGLEIQIFLTPGLVLLSILHCNLKCTVGSTKCPIKRGKGLTLGVYFQLAEIRTELREVQGRKRMPQGQKQSLRRGNGWDGERNHFWPRKGIIRNLYVTVLKHGPESFNALFMEMQVSASPLLNLGRLVAVSARRIL